MPYQGATTAIHQTQPDVGCSSVGPSYTGVGGSSSSPYLPVPPAEGDFFSPMSIQLQYDFVSLFTNDPVDNAAFGMQFMIPPYLIPSVQSPVLDLNSLFDVPDVGGEDNAGSEEEEHG